MFADWLTENGQPERGEFIYLQCRLANLPSADTFRSGLDRRARELLDRHADEWLGCLPRWARGEAVFHRGFVTGVRCSHTNFLSGAGTLFRVAPVRCLRLTGWRRHHWSIGMAAAFARLLNLDLSGNELYSSDACALAAAPQLVNLRELDLAGNRLDDDAAEALAGSPYLRGMETLSVADNPIGQRGWRALVRVFGGRVRL